MIAEATAFRDGIVIVQVNEIVDELPRVDIPGDWALHKECKPVAEPITLFEMNVDRPLENEQTALLSIRAVCTGTSFSRWCEHLARERKSVPERQG